MDVAKSPPLRLVEDRPRTLFSGEGYLSLKRLLDVCLGAALLSLFGPLMVLVALGIKLHSPGPILYRQRRIGKDGRPFEMLKFRSMRDGASSDPHREHVRRLIMQNTRPKDMGCDSLKLKADPRITGLGRFLRCLSLDELPQFINVLRGEMSLVGPRPPLPYEYELYTEWAKQRLDVLPGITGLWQVTGRNQVSFEEMVELDLAYIRRMNPLLDLWILFRTPLAMVRGKGGG